MNNFKGLFVYSITNMLERFGFYSMMAVLFLSFIDQRGYNPQEAGYYYSTFYISIYVAMFLMGIVGDLFNRRKVIYFGMIAMALGYTLYHFMAKSNDFSLIIPGVFVVLGVGAFKTNLQVQVGDLYKENIKNGATGYLIFYTLINLGAVFAPFTALYIKNEYGTNSVFLFSGMITLIAFALYYFIPVSAKCSNSTTNTKEDLLSKHNNNDQEFETSYNEANNTKFSTRKLIGLISLISIIPFLWVAFHQNGLVFTMFVRDFINSNGIQPEAIQSVNPIAYLLFSIIAIPLFFFLVKIKHIHSIFPIIGIGILLAALGYFIPAYAITSISGKLSAAYAIIPLVIITLGEFFISPFMILGIYHLSPNQLKGLFMGIFLIATAIGNQFLWIYAIVYDKNGAAKAFTGIVLHLLVCAAAVLIIWVIVKSLKK